MIDPKKENPEELPVLDHKGRPNMQDIMPPPGERLDVIGTNRDGEVVEVITNLGSEKEVREMQKPLGSRRLGDGGDQ